MKEYYSIGEFSALFGINIQTLYYYDQIGILKPALRNPQNGRRYYAFDQVYQLASIRFMRKLDCSIDQIKEFSAISDYRDSLDSLRMHSQKMREQWENLLLIDNIIQRKIQFVEECMQNLDVNSITIQSFSDRRYLPLGGEDRVYFHDSFYYYPTIVFYRNGQKFFGAYLDEHFEGVETPAQTINPVETHIIPAGSYVCAYHTGPYTTLEKTAHRILDQFHHLHLADEWVAFNIIDQFVDRNPGNYITGIQIPILSP